jgi:DNA-binding Xre family transcriptional regulator
MPLKIVNMNDPVKWPRFAKRLSELLEDRQITLYRLDEDTPLRSSNMSKIKAGTKRPTDEVLEALANYKPLNVRLEDLKGWRALDEVGDDAILSAAKTLMEQNPDKAKRLLNLLQEIE